MMTTRLWLSLTLAALMAGSFAAQDARGVLQAAAAAMGVADVKSIQYSGTGWQGMDASSRTFNQNLQRLKLDVARIVGIHGNPAPMTQLVQLMSKSQ